jgi:hypothetical protein
MSGRHATTLEMSVPVPSEAPVGADVILKAKVSCGAGCDLRGLPVNVIAPDGAPERHELATHEDGINQTEDIILRAPPRAGDYAWRISFPPHESDGVVHEASTLTATISIQPLATSLAVWDIPSPVVTGQRFKLKVGAKSAGGCALKGCAIAICDDSSATVASGRLGEAPLPGTSALYWTELEVIAPAGEGICSWSVKFDAPDLELAHDGASSLFSIAIVRPPEHRLSVKVVEKDTAAPIENAHVRLGPHRASTDPSGRAVLAMPSGTFELAIWKVGYEAEPIPVKIDGDTSVQVVAAIVPQEDPDAAWTM